MTEKKHIFLNGFMGAGKSKIGPYVAGGLGYTFLDTDKLIEQAAGKTIKDMFEQEDENYFRNLEQDMLKKLVEENKNAVIALGGGALVNPVNNMLIKQNGVTVYLKSSPEAIFQRVKHTSRRPLLEVPRDAHFETNLMLRIKELLAKRTELYETADVIIERDGLEPQQVAELIIKHVNTRL